MKNPLLLLSVLLLLSLIGCASPEQTYGSVETPTAPPPEILPVPTSVERVEQLEQPISEVVLNLESKEPAMAPEGAFQRVLIEREERILRGHIIREANNLFLDIADQPRLQLPQLLEVMVSQDGKTILQFGDEIRLTHPLRTDLFWVDQGGKTIEQVRDYFTGNAVIAMSEDGFTAIAGELYSKPDTMVLTLFSAMGEKLWEVQLEQDQRIGNLLVVPEGKYVVSLVTDRNDWLRNHQLQIRHDNGKRSMTISGNGILQKIVLVGDGNILFVQGLKGFGMIDLAMGDLMWWRDGEIRMISPYAAALSPNEAILFLLLADFQGKAEATYRWEFLVLEAASGSELLQEYLPEEYPSTWDQVFEQVTSDKIKILAGEQRLIYSWAQRD